MTGEVGREEAVLFHKRYPGKALFRGHGHAPRATCSPYGGSMRNRLVPGKKVRLGGKRGWIITCGALYRGLCMSWTPETGSVTSHRIGSEAFGSIAPGENEGGQAI